MRLKKESQESYKILRNKCRRYPPPPMLHLPSSTFVRTHLALVGGVLRDRRLTLHQGALVDRKQVRGGGRGGLVADRMVRFVMLLAAVVGWVSWLLGLRMVLRGVVRGVIVGVRRVLGERGLGRGVEGRSIVGALGGGGVVGGGVDALQVELVRRLVKVVAVGVVAKVVGGMVSGVVGSVEFLGVLGGVLHMLSVLNSSPTRCIAGIVGLLGCTRPEAIVKIPVEVAVRQTFRHGLKLFNVLAAEDSPTVQVFVRKATSKGLHLLLVHATRARVRG
jgi:hypothetical protein